MKRLPIMLAAIALFATGCSKDAPTAPATDDNHVQFKATLTTANEVPAIPNAIEAGAQGAATIDFILTRDSGGAITSGTVNFRVDLTNFPSDSVISAAHIHTGAAGVSGGVLVTADVTAGQVTLTNGAGTFSRLNLGISAANAQAIINNPAGFYFNVHTQRNTGGVIRGQLVKQ